MALSSVSTWVDTERAECVNLDRHEDASGRGGRAVITQVDTTEEKRRGLGPFRVEMLIKNHAEDENKLGFE
jgi:hypothetical protein